MDPVYERRPDQLGVVLPSPAAAGEGLRVGAVPGGARRSVGASVGNHGREARLPP